MQVLKIIHKGYPRLCHCAHGVVLAHALFFLKLKLLLSTRGQSENLLQQVKKYLSISMYNFILYFEKHKSYLRIKLHGKEYETYLDATSQNLERHLSLGKFQQTISIDLLLSVI